MLELYAQMFLELKILRLTGK